MSLCTARATTKASEVFRLLKPDARLGYVTWLITPLYDSSMSNHRSLRSKTAHAGDVPSLSIVEMRGTWLWVVGFKIIRDGG